MASTPTPADDVSLVIVVVDVNPYFWVEKANASTGTSDIDFEQFLQHVLAFMNAILLLNHMNYLAVIATGSDSCSFLYESLAGESVSDGEGKPPSKRMNKHHTPSAKIVRGLKDFVSKELAFKTERKDNGKRYSLLSGSLSMALCYVQRILRQDPPHPHPRILCFQGSPDASQQYIAVMNAIFSAQRLMVPIDSCMVGSQHSAFLQQAAHITGGIYMKPPHPEGLFEYLMMVFATDLHSRRFLQLPRPTGVDFRASCFCHKKTIDTGFVCSVCLSIFCKHHKECSTCGYSQVSHHRKEAMIHQIFKQILAKKWWKC
ncbi:hypothetical protein O6H91_01G149500 [Diphasiastrum complanatum]|uniref:Uncharacterized protein n=1 Tax=Diphasiastrum complanatum TaxID=34168 RepID=A0ACC2EXG4_DIPCM|nr:hypothetical protein O6H91_01G149500 [Diphasiastrum complanatum]